MRHFTHGRMPSLEAWLDHSRLSLSQRIQRFVFVMTMSVVLILGAGMLAITLTELPASQQKANQDAVNVLGEAMSNDMRGQIDSLRQLAASPLAWTALTDTTGREAYLKPFLIARENTPEGGPAQLLDYKGRHLMGSAAALPTQDGNEALVHQVLQKKQALTQVVQGPGDAALVVAVPILFPYSQEAIGVLVGTVNLSRIFARRIAGLSPQLSVDLLHHGQPLVRSQAHAEAGFAQVHFALPAQMDAGGLSLELRSSSNPWRAPLLKQLAFSLVAGQALGAVAWHMASVAASLLTQRINALARASEAVIEGRSDHIAEDSSPDEIGILSRTLNHSLQAYRNIHLHLEQLVADKTQELSASEARFRSLFEKNALVMLLVDPVGGQIVAANAAAAQFYGYAIERLQHMRISEINCLPPEQVAEEMRRAKLEQRNFFQFTHRLQSGQTRQVEVHSTPMKVGNQLLLYSVVHDVTERNRAQQQLKLSDMALKAISQGVVISEASGTVLSINRAFSSITGFEPEDIVGQTCRMLQGVGTDAQTIDAIRAAKQAATEFNGEILNYRKDGSSFWNDLTIAPVFDSVGALSHFVGITRDVTARKHAEARIQLAANVFTYAREGIMITSVDGLIIDTNKAFSHITGYGRDEVIGQNPRIFNSGRHDKAFYAAMWEALTQKGHWYGEVWNRRKNGELYVQMLNISAVRNAQNGIENFVALFSDITALKDHEQQLEHIAHYDALTGLANRVLLSDRLKIAMHQAQRRGQQLAVTYVDLDGFKAINDTHGHAVGDQLLMTVSARMKQALREGDTLARIGGDEFVAVLADLPEFASSVPVLSRLLAAAAQPVRFSDAATATDTELRVSASLGVAFFPQSMDVDADQLMRQADQAMYQAKLAGKNRYHVFDAEQDQTVRSQNESLERIRHALAEQEFALYYQPKVHLRSGAVLGMEALIRWHHPERGLILPMEFLPVIEDHALAIEVGEWVIANALAQMQAWRERGAQVPVSVNIGARQLQDADFFSHLSSKLSEYPALQAHSLEIEVLETSALQDFAIVSKVIDQCRSLGVLFALDDFGTGYSSMTYVKRLRFERLKIDQSFVRGMHENPNDRAILRAIVGLASALQREVIAEGVETVDHGLGLLQLGCEYAQGYGIARPMPAHAVLAWMQSWQPPSEWQTAPA